MRELLYLTHRMPYPPNKGDKIRSFHLLEYLSKRYRVHLGTFIDDPLDFQYIEKVKTYCAETCFIRINPKTAKLRSITGLFMNEALTLPYYYNTDLEHWIIDLLERRPVHHALVFSSAMAQYLMKANHLSRVIDFVDIDSDKWKQYANNKHWPLSWLYRREHRLLLDFERQVAKVFDASLFVSKEEASLFKQLAPDSANKTEFFSNGVNADYFSPDRGYLNPFLDDEQVFVFTGAMDYWPNVDAVRWFAQEIFPELLSTYPNARFYIVGSRPGATVQALAELPGVKVTGAVADIRPYLKHALMAVAPLRIARGLQNKVLEAMAMAKVVVATSQAAEGISGVPDKELFIADNQSAFIKVIKNLIKENAFAEVGNAARARVLADFDWEQNLSRVNDLLAVASES